MNFAFLAQIFNFAGRYEEDSDEICICPDGSMVLLEYHRFRRAFLHQVRRKVRHFYSSRNFM